MSFPNLVWKLEDGLWKAAAFGVPGYFTVDGNVLSSYALSAPMELRSARHARGFAEKIFLDVLVKETGLVARRQVEKV